MKHGVLATKADAGLWSRKWGEKGRHLASRLVRNTNDVEITSIFSWIFKCGVRRRMPHVYEAQGGEGGRREERGEKREKRERKYTCCWTCCFNLPEMSSAVRAERIESTVSPDLTTPQDEMLRRPRLTREDPPL